MSKKALYVLFLLLGLATMDAQESANCSELLNNAKVQVYHNPKEAINIAEYVLRTSKIGEERLSAYYLIGRSYFVQGRHNEALKTLMDIPEPETPKEQVLAFKTQVLLSDIQTDLGLYELSKHTMDKAMDILNPLPSTTQTALLVKQNQDSAFYYLDTKNPALAKTFFEKASKESGAASLLDFREILVNNDLALAEWYITAFQLDSAMAYLNKTSRFSRAYPNGNYLEMQALIGYGKWFFIDKQHQRALDSLERANIIATKLQHLGQLIRIKEQQAANYLAMNQTDVFRQATLDLESLVFQRDNITDDAINTIFDRIKDEQSQSLESIDRIDGMWLKYLWIGIGVVIIAFVLLLLRFRGKLRQFQQFKNYLERFNKQQESTQTQNLEIKKSLNISKGTEDALLEKLQDFESSNAFINNDISLAQLAGQCQTNTKYLSEVINQQKGKNFNQYINELRIDYIIEKLRNVPQYRQYKVSYLAEESGFSSHSNFATVFKAITGISPTAFIEIINEQHLKKGGDYAA